MRQELLRGSAYSWCSTRSHCYRIFLNINQARIENGTENSKTLGIGGVPGCILLCWNVGMADRMFRCWFWHWL